MPEPEVYLDTTHIRELEERSDIDQHQSKQAIRRQLAAEGEDWGDGFFVQTEPVMIERGADGAIIRTTPLSEVRYWEKDTTPPVEADPIPTLKPIPLSEREKLVTVLALRLFKYYKSMPPSLTRYNPIYDGILDAPPGSSVLLQPLPGSKLYLASETEVFEWLKNKVIGPRVRIVEKKQGRDPYHPELATNYDVQFTRNPA